MTYLQKMTEAAQLVAAHKREQQMTQKSDLAFGKHVVESLSGFRAAPAPALSSSDFDVPALSIAEIDAEIAYRARMAAVAEMDSYGATAIGYLQAFVDVGGNPHSDPQVAVDALRELAVPLLAKYGDAVKRAKGEA